MFVLEKFFKADESVAGGFAQVDRLSGVQFESLDDVEYAAVAFVAFI